MADVKVTVEGRRPVGRIERIWMSYGYDEINWTSTPRGRANTATLRDLFGGPAVVRAHNLLTSGNGRALPHWSSGNVYHEDGQGSALYDWGLADATFDVWVDHGMPPIVELGFCPVQLARRSAKVFHPMPSLYGEYESWGFASPPRDELRWSGLVEAVARHFLKRYGASRLSEWYWEFWNEPDISYWDGTLEEYCQYYDLTATALRRALREPRVGGPATTGQGTVFLDRFLGHCVAGTHAPGGRAVGAPDFVSFHTKGTPGFTRTYGPIGPDGAAGDEDRSPSTAKMLNEINANLDVVRSYPSLAEAPVLVDECDPGVPAHMGVFDNRNYGYRNTEYYAVFQLQLMAALVGEQPGGRKGVSLATAWAWYMEGDRFFEGTRSFFTASDILAPVANAYRMLSMLGDRRLKARVEHRGTEAPAGAVNALPSARPDGGVVVIVWHHNDDQYVHGECHVEVEIADLPCAGRPVRVTEYLIDAEHSNSHSAWRALGAPQDPSREEVEAIKARASLEPVHEETLENCPESLARQMTLRCPAAALIEVAPA